MLEYWTAPVSGSFFEIPDVTVVLGERVPRIDDELLVARILILGIRVGFLYVINPSDEKLLVLEWIGVIDTEVVGIIVGLVLGEGAAVINFWDELLEVLFARPVGKLARWVGWGLIDITILVGAILDELEYKEFPVIVGKVIFNARYRWYVWEDAFVFFTFVIDSSWLFCNNEFK